MKELCLKNAKEALMVREQLITLANDITNPVERRARYDISGFLFVAGGFAAELNKMGFDVVAAKVKDAARRYPSTFDENAADSSADLMIAKNILEKHMFEKFCECEKL